MARTGRSEAGKQTGADNREMEAKLWAAADALENVVRDYAAFVRRITTRATPNGCFIRRRHMGGQTS
jgi:hypothetical protein